jgi:hypothetical protein
MTDPLKLDPFHGSVRNSCNLEWGALCVQRSGTVGVFTMLDQLLTVNLVPPCLHTPR